MRLVEILRALPRERFLLSGQSGDRTVGQLLEYAEVQGEKLRGSRLALKIADPIAGIEAMIAADGQAHSITLLTHSLSDQHLSTLLERAGCDLLIDVSDSVGVALTSSVRCFSSLHAVTTRGATPDKVEVETTWHLATSGTTGVPKLVAHTLRSLSRTAKRGTATGEASCWGLLYDYTRFAGLQVVLQAIFGGSRLIAPSSGLPLRERLAMLVAQGCTHLSATPSLWRNIIMTPGASELPLRQITLGGEIADARILAALKSIYPSARITHIYASTEAGVGFSVKDGEPGFPAYYLDEPPSGLALRLVDGRLQIRNTDIHPTYVGTGDGFGAEDGWIDTGDSVNCIGGRVHFLGRASGAINVGGNKVHPEEVERLLLNHPQIRAARVFGKPSSITGTLVVADIVPVQPPHDPASFCADIKTYLQNRAQGFKVPAMLNLVDYIEITATGKLAR